MKRTYRYIVSFAALMPLTVFAAGENNIGACGAGSYLFQNQAGVAPQVFALSTNASASQSFAISSGTSGCTQDGVVSSNWKTAVFIDHNKERLARDMSVGSGEALDSLAHLLGVQEQDRAAFNSATKDNLARIFGENASTNEIVAALRQVLGSDAQLARYTAAL